MTIPPIPPSHALTTLDEDGAILPDVRARMMRLFEKKKAAYKQAIQFRNLCAIGAAVIFGFLLFLSATSDFQEHKAFPAFFLPIFALALGGLYFEMTKDRHKRLKFPCPYCNTHINLLEKWVCGNCRKTNNDERHEFSTALHDCEEEVCTSTKQTAFVCPRCERHIILDKARYHELNSSQPPHHGVAVYHSFAKQIGALFELADKLQSEKSSDKQFFRD